MQKSHGRRKEGKIKKEEAKEGRDGVWGCVSLFTIPYSRHTFGTPLLHLWAHPILGPVISDNVNDLAESPSTTDDLWHVGRLGKRGRTRQVSVGSVWDPGMPWRWWFIIFKTSVTSYFKAAAAHTCMEGESFFFFFQVAKVGRGG